jgi:hypothetical protein
MVLVSTQPLVKMSNRNIPGGKGGQCVKLPTLPLSRAECHEIWEPKPPGTLWATPGLLRDCFNFTCWNPLGHTGPVTGLLYLYLLEPTGPHRACYGTALHLPAGTLWATPGLLRDCFTFTCCNQIGRTSRGAGVINSVVL